MIDLLSQNNFLQLAIITLIAITTSSLGPYTLWQKLSYFGDALSHSMLLGVVIGSFFAVNQIFAIVSFCIIFSLVFYFISSNKFFSKDTITMILSYFCLAFAFLAVGDPEKLHDFIFGSLSGVTISDVWFLSILALISVIYSKIAFKKLLQININQDLAQIDGINVKFWQISFLILLSCVIALSVKVVGVFLMTALLILPAAIARIFSDSAKKMCLYTYFISIGISLFSFSASSYLGYEAGPVIILSFFAIFILSLLVKKQK